MLQIILNILWVTVFRTNIYLTLFKFFYLIFYITILHKSLIIHENSGMFKDVYEGVNFINLILVEKCREKKLFKVIKIFKIYCLSDIENRFYT